MSLAPEGRGRRALGSRERGGDVGNVSSGHSQGRCHRKIGRGGGGGTGGGGGENVAGAHAGGGGHRRGGGGGGGVRGGGGVVSIAGAAVQGAAVDAGEIAGAPAVFVGLGAAQEIEDPAAAGAGGFDGVGEG